MSTKRSLWYSDEYHLYGEGLDDKNIYLEIKSSPFEELVLKIPLTAWKEMRKHTLEPAERYLGMSDDEFLLEAEREVDKHRAELKRYQEEESKHAGLLSMFGFLLYGPPESGREEMIARFAETYRPELVKLLSSTD